MATDTVAAEAKNIKTIGRAARNIHGTAILYADDVTGSMQRAIDETNRRRDKQVAYNEEHGIVPRSTTAPLTPLEADEEEPDARKAKGRGKSEPDANEMPIGVGELADADLLPSEIEARLHGLRKKMRTLADDLRYEEAARVRDRIQVLEARQLELGGAG